MRQAGAKDEQLYPKLSYPNFYRRWPEMARVLIVDDAAFMRKMVSDALVKAGHEVIAEATNGVEAVAPSRRSSPIWRRSTSRCP